MVVNPGIRHIFLALTALLTIVVLSGADALALTREERIAQARRDWLVGVSTEKRIAAEMENYRKSANASEEVLQLYETYLDRVRRLTAEKRRTLEALVGPKGLDGRSRTSVGKTPGRSGQPAYDPQIPEDRELDQGRALDQEFNRSLAAFDDMLLKEIEQSRVETDLKMKRLAQEAARAAKSLREQGRMEGSDGAEQGMQEGQSADGSGNETGEMESDGQGQNQPPSGPSGDQDTAASQEASGEGTDMAQADEKKAKGTASGESETGDDDNLNTQDDDIVARQLREAAEKETDPELKEKLWKEYREYKKSI